MAPQVFAVPVFLVVFRETLETVIIVSVLLAWLKQTLDGPGRDVKVYKKLRRQVSPINYHHNTTQHKHTDRTHETAFSDSFHQVWAGTGLGFFICLVVAAAVIGTFYTVGVNNWDTSEMYYEGAFALFASFIITVVGAALLRISKMQEKWRVKLAAALDGPIVKTGTRFGWFKTFSEKYALFILPFVTVLREGIEAIIFVAGVSFSAPASAFPLPAVVGLLVGILVGYILYKYVPTQFSQLRPFPTDSSSQVWILG
ncbi:hypothetical protein diail_4848 [Diaporthe ilicicola]|nr:hypothetical protein diail_4848 [Diaporthe ilicicola]